jgi:hypothetical protein
MALYDAASAVCGAATWKQARGLWLAMWRLALGSRHQYQSVGIPSQSSAVSSRQRAEAKSPAAIALLLW